ncbi:uncharacterized protein LOC118935453 isoform X2 [Manis pentadactyla]|uniref:uncharacterized protein LOC118935453 isoform X2 n=1 Tax=Manis pentadactyla TaxID=143292 RepID=UPI00255D0605|nr:uncharacterized protein LOC118935453 isoform X2 [Manis pentadactyla]
MQPAGLTRSRRGREGVPAFPAPVPESTLPGHVQPLRPAQPPPLSAGARVAAPAGGQAPGKAQREACAQRAACRGPGLGGNSHVNGADRRPTHRLAARTRAPWGSKRPAGEGVVSHWLPGCAAAEHPRCRLPFGARLTSPRGPQPLQDLPPRLTPSSPWPVLPRHTGFFLFPQDPECFSASGFLPGRYPASGIFSFSALKGSAPVAGILATRKVKPGESCRRFGCLRREVTHHF